MNKLYIVDRIEGNIVIVEAPSGEMIDVQKILIEGHFKEGDCLIYNGSHYIVDREATEKRKKEVANFMKGMWKN